MSDTGTAMIGNERRPPPLEEDEDHDDHQEHGDDEGHDDLMKPCGDRAGGVEARSRNPDRPGRTP